MVYTHSLPEEKFNWFTACVIIFSLIGTVLALKEKDFYYFGIATASILSYLMARLMLKRSLQLFIGSTALSFALVCFLDTLMISGRFEQFLTRIAFYLLAALLFSGLGIIQLRKKADE